MSSSFISIERVLHFVCLRNSYLQWRGKIFNSPILKVCNILIIIQQKNVNNAAGFAGIYI